MSNSLNQNFTLGKIIKFTLPSIGMMVFLSIYTMVDGFFVSNFVSEDAFAAVNIIFPFQTLIIAIGTMFSTGGSAIVSKTLGEGNKAKANQIFTLITVVATAIGVFLGAIGLAFTNQISNFLGSTELIKNDCNIYLITLAVFAPFLIVQILSQMFFVVDGKPNLGLIVTAIGGACNIIFDYVFIVVLKFGIAGAGIATGISYLIPAIVFIIHFFKKGENKLHFSKFIWRTKELLSTMANGSSEMVVNLSNTITAILFNIIILNIVDEKGVVAIGIILYVQFLLISVFVGYSQGIAPVIGFAYGAKNYTQLKKVVKTSIILVVVGSFVSYGLSFLIDDFLIGLFLKRTSEAFSLTQSGFTVFSLCFIFIGLNIFASSLFTALSNGKISALISFLRTLFFVVITVVTLPNIIGIDGVWLAIPIAELLSIFVSIFFIVKQKGYYNY